MPDISIGLLHYLLTSNRETAITVVLNYIITLDIIHCMSTFYICHKLRRDSSSCLCSSQLSTLTFACILSKPVFYISCWRRYHRPMFNICVAMRKYFGSGCTISPGNELAIAAKIAASQCVRELCEMTKNSILMTYDGSLVYW